MSAPPSTIAVTNAEPLVIFKSEFVTVRITDLNATPEDVRAMLALLGVSPAKPPIEVDAEGGPA